MTDKYTLFCIIPAILMKRVSGTGSKAESIEMQFNCEYSDKANGTTHVSAISKKEWLNQQERKESRMKKLITGTHHTAIRFHGEEKLNRALSLYNAINGSSYQDASQLTIVTMKDVLLISWMV